MKGLFNVIGNKNYGKIFNILLIFLQKNLDFGSFWEPNHNFNRHNLIFATSIGINESP